MKWTDKDILEWHKKTFPNCTVEEQADKVGEEIHEMIMAIVNEESKERLAEEVADVYIASLVLKERFGVDLLLPVEAIDKKMDENVKRKWVGNHHVD